MTIRTKTLVVGGLLAALGSGCEITRDELVADCEVDISRARVVYHQIEGKLDKYTVELGNNIFEFFADGELKSGSITCKDGRVIRFDEGEDPYIQVPQGGN